MTLVAEARTPRLWHLWNTDYRYGTEVSDEGFILRTDHGWALHERGAPARLKATYPTLDDAMRAAGVTNPVSAESPAPRVS